MMNRMKKTMKRTLATVLTLAMVLAMLPAGPARVFAVATQLTDPNLQYFTGDDFNDREAFEANWTTSSSPGDKWILSENFPAAWDNKSESEKLDAMLNGVNGITDTDGDGTVTDEEGYVSYFDHREGTGDKFLSIHGLSTSMYAQPAKWSEGNKPLTMELDFRLSPSNYTTGETTSFDIPLASDGTNTLKISVGLGDGNSYRTSLTMIAKNGGTNLHSGNSTKLLVPCWGDNSASQFNATPYTWTHLKVSYDYTNWAASRKFDVTIEVTATVGELTGKKYDTTTSSYIDTGKEAGSINVATTTQKTVTQTYTVDFSSGTSDTLTLKFNSAPFTIKANIDNLTVKSTAQKAQEFYNTYSGFLGQDPETMTNSDFDAFTAMYNAWAVLDDQSKAMLAGSGINQALVDAFADVFASLCGRLESDDFSDAFKTENWWNNVDGTNAYVQDGALVITPNTNTNTAYVTPKVWAEGERPTKLTFDYKDTDSTKAGAIFAFAYSPDGAGAGSAYGGGLFAYAADGGTSWHNLGSWIPGKASTSGDQSDRFIAKQYGGANSYGIADTSWITIEGVYDWSNYDTNGKVKVTYDITHVNGAPVELNSRSFTYTFSNYANVKTLYPAFLSTSTTYCIDNVVIETNAKAANAYKETYGEFLAKESVTEADLNNYLAAYDAYNAVDASSKAFLTAEKAKLDAFKSQFDALYAGQKLSDIDFDSGFIADQFFETTGGSVSYADSKVQIPSGVSYALKSGRLEGKPQSMSFNFCYPNGSSKLVLLTEGGKTAYINFGDTLIRVYSDSDITQSPNDNGAKLLNCESNMSIDFVGGNLKKAAVWDTSQMITLTANYDYSQWDSNIIKVSFDIKFWGYNFDFGADKKPVDMNNASGTYTPGWVEHKNIQTFTFTFENVENVKFEPKFVSSGTTQVDSISATYRDEQMENLLERINSLVITPATFGQLETLKQQYTNSGKTYAAVEAALAAKQAAADALHPTTLGGTIKTTNNVRKQNLKILAAAPTASAPEGFRVSRIGVLFLPKNMLNGELTVDTPSVANGSLAVTSVPAQFSGELTDSALNPAWCAAEFATRCYVVYTDGTQEYIVYGETITRSIYGIAREMANAVLAKAQSDAEYSATVTYTNAVPNGTANVDNVANEDVLAFITANVSAVNALPKQ